MVCLESDPYPQSAVVYNVRCLRDRGKVLQTLLSFAKHSVRIEGVSPCYAMKLFERLAG